jgi:hypothetical protein
VTERVYLHVGPFKTGTTYLQGLLTANADRLAEQGVLYPGGTFARQSRAIHDALGRESMPSSDRDIAGQWDRLAAEIRGWPGTAAVLSQETLSAAERKDVAQLYGRIASPDLHVIYTARDLSRVAPAMWQTSLRSRQTATWADYLAALRSPDRFSRKAGRHFWRCQDAAAVLGLWRGHVPVENLHVVTVPRSGSPPELLWQRFCQVLGVDTQDHDLQPDRANPSLGAAEAELLRRLNSRLADTDINPKNWLFGIRWLARGLEQRPGAVRFALPPEDISWISSRAENIVRALRAAGYPVVGDLDELLPQPGPDDGRTPGAYRDDSIASDAEILDAAVDALERAVRHVGENRRRRGGSG